MDIVIDTSAVLGILLNEKQHSQLVELTSGFTLMAPASLEAEIGNALTAMLKRRRIDAEQAHSVIREFRRMPIQLLPLDLDGCIELAARHGVYAYDAYVVSCAVRYNCTLLALDRGLLSVARREGVPILEVPE